MPRSLMEAISFSMGVSKAQMGDAPAIQPGKQRGKGRLVVRMATRQHEQIARHQAILRIILPWFVPLNSRMNAA